jgi:hypothetical protein
MVIPYIFIYMIIIGICLGLCLGFFFDEVLRNPKGAMVCCALWPVFIPALIIGYIFF